ncbi:hypothetical protein ACFXC8_25175, partial [Streptomyces sp. NPDC059441]
MPGRTDILLLAILLLALLGKTSDAVLGAAERHVVRRWSWCRGTRACFESPVWSATPGTAPRRVVGI